MSALTIIDLRRSGRALVAACNECGHRSTLMATNPKLPPDLKWSKRAPNLRVQLAAAGTSRPIRRAGGRSEWLNMRGSNSVTKTEW